MERGRVCVVIPAHDEARTIGDVVRRARRFVEEVLVLDDGSRDGSAAAAAGAGARVLRWPTQRGKGTVLRAALDATLRQGFEAAITLDGDGQHLPEEIPRFLAAYLDGAELVVGDRSADFARLPLPRHLANRVMTAVLRPLAGAGLRDTQCGFRLLSARLYHSLALRCEHFDAESEVLIQAHALGVDAVQVPVSAVYAGERSKIRILPDTLRFVRLVARAALSDRAPAAARRLSIISVSARDSG